MAWIILVIIDTDIIPRNLSCLHVCPIQSNLGQSIPFILGTLSFSIKAVGDMKQRDLKISHIINRRNFIKYIYTIYRISPGLDVQGCVSENSHETKMTRTDGETMPKTN